MARVGIDLDGVVADFVDSYRNHCRDTHSDSSATYPEPTHWNFYRDKEWGSLSTSDFTACMRHYGHKIFCDAKPYPGAEQALVRLADAGHTLVFITDRSVVKGAYGITVDWMTNKMPDVAEFDYELHITADKASVPVDYFIDDKPENLASMPSKVHIALCDRPWNQESKIRRMTLDVFVDKVLEREEMISHSSPTARYDQNEIRVVSPTGGAKGKKLARFDLIPPRAMVKVAEIYGRGAEKYDDWNWRKGYDWSLSLAALERHLNAFKAGESTHEDGHHLASVVFHALALMTFEEEHPELDDRFKAS